MSDHFWSVGSPLFWVAVCHCAWLTELSVPQPVNQPVLGPWCYRQGWVLSTLPPSAVRTGLGKPRWDVLAFRHHPLQEGRGRWEEGLWALKPPQQAQGGELVSLPSRCSTSGVTKGEGVRVQGLQGHLRVPPVSISIWTLCRQDNHCDK